MRGVAAHAAERATHPLRLLGQRGPRRAPRREGRGADLAARGRREPCRWAAATRPCGPRTWWLPCARARVDAAGRPLVAARLRARRPRTRQGAAAADALSACRGIAAPFAWSAHNAALALFPQEGPLRRASWGDDVAQALVHGAVDHARAGWCPLAARLRAATARSPSCSSSSPRTTAPSRRASSGSWCLEEGSRPKGRSSRPPRVSSSAPCSTTPRPSCTRTCSTLSSCTASRTTSTARPTAGCG